jgi:tetratricopeptide (TPR) repeat protein
MMATPLINTSTQCGINNSSSSGSSNVSSPLKPIQDATTKEPSNAMNPLLECVLDDLKRSEREGDLAQTIEAWNALGLIRLHTQRNASEALKCHKQALSLCSKAMETSITWTDMGLCYERLGDEQEALLCYQRAYELLEDSVSESHPRRAGLKRVLARLRRM